MRDLTPRQIVAELDRNIVGQHDAKRAVAIAVRNRWRRQQLPAEMRGEIAPKNILMIGPTGVGKTEIARRLAKLTGAPFIKVEATKYTEVGYYGRDVESMIRDLVEHAITLVKLAERQKIEPEARRRAAERLIDLLAPAPASGPYASPATYEGPAAEEGLAARERSGEGSHVAERYQRTRERMREKLAAGELDERRVELTLEQKPAPMMLAGMGLEQLDVDLQGMFEKMLPRNSVRREVKVVEARKILLEQECEALINQEQVTSEAVSLAENLGIVFLDEIDKVVATESTRGPDVSRQGVQRDLLPIVEGTTVQTKYGYVRTDHILFIAAGAFHRTRPSDLMPELQGRFPIRVELTDLTKEDFVRILTEPRSALSKQYAELLRTEGLDLDFRPDGIETLAEYAFHVNQTSQNIGARRLYTMLERLLEDVSFEAPDMPEKRVVIDADYVRQRLEKLSQDEDLSKFIL